MLFNQVTDDFVFGKSNRFYTKIHVHCPNYRKISTAIVNCLTESELLMPLIYLVLTKHRFVDCINLTRLF